MSFNSALAMEGSYYVASANPFAPVDTLVGEHTADLVVIGGGCTGLSAALHAAERGYSVILLEGGRIGWGASGRNGGQMIPGLRKDAGTLVRLYGKETGKALFRLALEARDLVCGLIETHRIVCDLKLTGHLSAAHKPSHVDDMRHEAEFLAREMDYHAVEVLNATQVMGEVVSPGYHGGLVDKRGGHMHPLNYTLGLADVARRSGVRLFEQSPATTVEDSPSGVRVTTPAGVVKARHAVIACDALLGNLQPKLAARIMPVANYIGTTEPLADGDAAIPHDMAVSDTRFVVNYFRLTADRRLLFGGGERYTPNPPADIAGFVRPHIAKVFPHLAGRRIDYAWGGMVSVTTTRLPDIGRMGNLFYAHGYSGQGVILTTLAGKLVAEAVAGTTERFDLFAKMAPPAFPGGTALRYPLYILGMLWYALRDRL